MSFWCHLNLTLYWGTWISSSRFGGFRLYSIFIGNSYMCHYGYNLKISNPTLPLPTLYLCQAIMLPGDGVNAWRRVVRSLGQRPLFKKPKPDSALFCPFMRARNRTVGTKKRKTKPCLDWTISFAIRSRSWAACGAQRQILFVGVSSLCFITLHKSSLNPK